jgi:uncharacterized protein (TIGR03437 family)
VDVTIDVDALQPAKLSALPGAILLGGREGTELARQSLVLENAGEKSVTFSAQPMADWIKLGEEGSVQSNIDPRSRLNVPLTIDVSKLPAGAHRSAVRLTSATTLQSFDVPVAVVLAAIEKPRLELSQQGVTLLTSSDYESDNQTLPIGVLNTGAGTLNWAASTTTPWLRLVNPQGEAVANSSNIRRFEVGLNKAESRSLAVGRQESVVRVESPEGGVRELKVTLDKRGSGQLPMRVSPTSLVFVSEEGGSLPASQNVTIYSRSSINDLSVTVEPMGVTTASRGTFTIPSLKESILTIGVNGDNSTPGTRSNPVRITAGGLTVEVQVAWLVVPRGTFSTLNCGNTPPIAAITSLASDFVISAGDPVQLVATALNGCGNPLTEGSVVASFSNADSPVALRHVGNSEWEGTWVPKRDAADRVEIRLLASASGVSESTTGTSAAFTISGILQPNLITPVIGDSGVVNFASPGEEGAPLAPGAWVSINGLNLASQPGIADGNPLPSQIDETSVRLGDASLPLLRVNSALVLAQLPYDADSGLTSQLVVRRGGTSSAPESVAIAASTPRIFTIGNPGEGRGVIVDAESGQLIGPSNRLSAGKRVFIYASGLGAVDPLIDAGAAVPDAGQPSVKSPVQVLFDGIEAQVESAVLSSSDLKGAEKWLEQLAPAFVGIYRITAIVPEGLSPGNARLLLKAGGSSSLPVSVEVQ